MAKRNASTPDPTSSRNTLILLAVGCLLVGGLVVWALTRTVEPTPIDSTATAVQQTAQPSPLGTTTSPLATPPLQTTMPPTTTAPSFPPADTDSIDGAAVQASADAVPRMSAEDLREKLNRNEVTVIDVRDQAAYMQGHIPGALHMPFATVQMQMQTLPKNKPIVTYCT